MIHLFLISLHLSRSLFISFDLSSSLDLPCLSRLDSLLHLSASHFISSWSLFISWSVWFIYYWYLFVSLDLSWSSFLISLHLSWSPFFISLGLSFSSDLQLRFRAHCQKNPESWQVLGGAPYAWCVCLITNVFDVHKHTGQTVDVATYPASLPNDSRHTMEIVE